MKQHAKKTTLWGGGLAVICLLVYLLIFEIPLTFTPLRYKPQEMTVWRYGESITLQPGDKDFNALYRLLRDAGKGTISHIVRYDAISDSYRPHLRFVNDQNLYQKKAITVYVKYDDVQKGRLFPAVGNEYNLVAFIVGSKYKEIEDSLWDPATVMYVNTDGGVKPNWHSFAWYGSLDRVAEYVNSMSFAG